MQQVLICTTTWLQVLQMSSQFFTQWKNLCFCSLGVSLDMDCTKGYGPETITLARLEAGSYKYRVNNFGWDNKGTVSQPLLDSDAQVTLYTSDYQRQYLVGLNGYVDVSTRSPKSFCIHNKSSILLWCTSYVCRKQIGMSLPSTAKQGKWLNVPLSCVPRQM